MVRTGSGAGFLLAFAAWSWCWAGALVAGQVRFPQSSIQLGENLTVLEFHDLSKDSASVEPLRQALAEGEHFAFGVEVLHNGETYPDILLTLTEATDTGDTDIYCHPRQLAVAFGAPTPQFSVWSSDHTKGNDVIFISRRSELYVGETSPNVTVDGEVYPAARFVCVLRGTGLAGTESRLDVDVLYAERSLVKQEQEALKNIFDKCCMGDRPCPVDKDSTPRGGNGGNAGKKKGNPLDFCHFPGSICNEDGRLVRLFLQSFNLNCEFPLDEFKEFKQLRKLDLDSNMLNGDILEIAEGLSALENLEWLSANANNISGELAAEGSGGLCELAGGSIEFVSLNLNRIGGGVPECAFTEGSSIKELHLDGNDLVGALPEFSPASPLNTLSVSGARLSGSIPESLGEVEQLRGLRLSRNLLEGVIPSNLASGKFLTAIHLDNNNLEGRIPDSMASSSSLRDLQLFDNNFTGLPQAWEVGPADTSSLRYLHLGSNQIESAFPIGLGDLQNLTYLNIAHNKFGGSLPDVQDLFPALASVIIAYNEFTGSLPASFSSLGLFAGTAAPEGPYIFTVAHNNLTGDIPEFLFDSNRPPYLGPNVFLGGNRFTCPEPDQLHTVPDLICFVKCSEEGNALSQQLLTGNEDRIDIKDDSRKGVSNNAAITLGVLVAVLASTLVVVLLGLYITMRRKKRTKEIDAVLGEDSKGIEVGVRRR